MILGKYTFRLACLVLLAFTGVATAQTDGVWVPMGPFGGDVRALVADPQQPDRMYLGTRTGQVYLSMDAGRSWNRLAGLDAPSFWVVDDLLIDPGNSAVLYAGMWSVRDWGGGVFRSDDGGQSWALLEGVSGQAVRALALSLSDSRVLVAGTREGVFRSHDSGVHWQRISPLGHPEIRNLESVAIDPHNPNTIYVGTWHLPWKTTDGGASWNSIKKGMVDDSDVFTLVVDPRNPNRLFGGACTGIYRSDSGGAEWKKVQGMPESARRTHTLVLDLHDPATVYAGTTQGLWRSQDGGQNWARLTPNRWVINSVVLDPTDPQHLYLGMDDAGVMESRDGGKTFRTANEGFAQRQVARIVTDPIRKGRIYAALIHDGEFGGVFATDNDGAGWQQFSQGLEGRDVLSLLVLHDSAGTLLAGTPDGVFEYIAEPPGWKSQSQWEGVATKDRQQIQPKVWDLYQRRPEEPIFAATSAGLFQSTDARTWKRISVDPGGGGVYAVASLGADGATLLAATISGLHISRDAGQTWTSAPFNGDRAFRVFRVFRLTTHPTRPQTVFAGTDLGLFRSTDSGQSWQRFGRGIPFSPIREIIVSKEDDRHVLVAAEAGVFVSLDGGNTYERFRDGHGPEMLPVQLLAFHPIENVRVLAGSVHNGLFLTDGRQVLASREHAPTE
ncbi:MAG: transcriptional regulator [Acidobacteria bacterium]|nr:transcriptional regulator [Acidobacteriota bacterium]